MLDQNTSALLLSVADQFSLSAKIFMGADEWFQRQSHMGYALFMKKEWKERYRYCGQVRQHVIEHRGDVPHIAATPAAKSIYSTEAIVCSALTFCINADKNVLNHLDQVTSNLSDQKKHSCVDFLHRIREKFYVDINEVYHEKELAEYTASYPPGILLLNKGLLERYAK